MTSKNARRYVGPFLLGFALLVVSGCGTEHLFERGTRNPMGPTNDGPPSFAQDVLPALSSCISCHGSGTGNWVYDGGADAYNQVLEQVDSESPAASGVLVKGSGGDSHGGGSHFSVGSANYNAILAWIEDGAGDN